MAQQYGNDSGRCDGEERTAGGDERTAVRHPRPAVTTWRGGARSSRHPVSS